MSDERPERWWILDPVAHEAFYCAICSRSLPQDHNIPALQDAPLCAICATGQLTDTPMTAEFVQWMEDGDPRWWSAWLCNCDHCRALEALG